MKLELISGVDVEIKFNKQVENARYNRKKIGMTSIYSVEGKALPCTIIEAGPCVVTQVKTIEKTVRLHSLVSEIKAPNALKGHFAKAKTSPKAN